MKVYWSKGNRRVALILDDMKKGNAQPVESKWPRSELYVGDNEIFIYHSEYHIDGCSLSLEDLELLVKKLRERTEPEAS